MDDLLLEALVAELRDDLPGRRLEGIASVGEEGIVLLFGDPRARRLLLGVSPALPRLHLTRERLPRRGDGGSGFARRAAHELTGRTLVGLEKDPCERVVRLRFGAASGRGPSLLAELLGRSSNLLVLDPADRVIAFLRTLKSRFRAPVVGASWEAPPRASRRDPRELLAQEIAEIQERSSREDHPLADLLLEACPAIGGLAAREIEHRVERGASPYAVLREWLVRVHGGSGMADSGTEGAPGSATGEGSPLGGWSGPGASVTESATRLDGSLPASELTPPRGFVYADAPPEALDLAHAPLPGRFLLSWLTLSSADPALSVFAYPTLNEAADAYYGALARGLAFRRRRDALAGIARREAKRAGEIAAKVAHDLEGMERAPRDRLHGEALLAGLTRATRTGNTVLVPDPYDPAEGVLAIPIDPALTLQANAARFFARHRKAERGRIVAAARLAAQSRRRDELEPLAARIETAARDEDLARAESELRGHGIAVGLIRRRRRDPRPAPEPRAEGVRLYASSEGYEILVGKGAEENDRLTFKIAAPEDFWLHAAGVAGAHVVVRNPKLEKRLPVRTLREAAELAALFSRSKDEGRVEVHWTRRKYVRRVRGGPRGLVTLKKHETLAVSPRDPFG